MKYFKRIFTEAEDEFEEKGIRSLPFIEALAVMIIISRGMAEAIEIFPYSVSKYLVYLADRWVSITIPYLDNVYKLLGYPFAPDITLQPVYPHENPVYPLCTYMITLWGFSIIYTFIYWITFTGLTYLISLGLGGRGSYVRILTWIGLAHIPMINWWFYTGCEMLYELVQQEIYMNIFPPYHNSGIKIRIDTPWGPLPAYLPVEGFWAGYGFGVFSMILTILLITAFTTREFRLGYRRGLIASLPWIIYLILILIGSLNIDSIVQALNEYVSNREAWSWFGR